MFQSSNNLTFSQILRQDSQANENAAGDDDEQQDDEDEGISRGSATVAYLDHHALDIEAKVEEVRYILNNNNAFLVSVLCMRIFRKLLHFINFVFRHIVGRSVCS